MNTKTYSESRLRKAYSTLRESISGDGFAFVDAETALGLSKRSINLILKDLIEERLIIRTGRGTYAFLGKPSPVVSIEELSEGSKKIHNALGHYGLEYALSCLDILVDYTHLLPRRFPHFCWVRSGSEDWAMEIIEEASLTPLREPTGSDILLAMELTSESDVIIIRKTSIFYAALFGLASIERALVDLHYEVTRERYPLDGAELMRIYYNTMTSISLEYPKMLRYAGLRRFRGEIEWVLWKFQDRTDIPKTYLTEPLSLNKFVRRLPSLDDALLR